MLSDPTILSTEPQPCAVVDVDTPRSEIVAAMDAGMQELMGALVAQGCGPAGPHWTHHLRMSPERFTFELAAPTSRPVEPTGRVRAGVLPGGRVARAVHAGPFEGLAEAWGQLRRWIEEQGERLAPNLQERYLVGPEHSPDPADWRTELNQFLAD